MHNTNIEKRIKEIGHSFFNAIEGEQPSIFNKDWWTGKVLDWAMHNEIFKVQLFRFVDTLPGLQTEQSLVRHVKEYFGQDSKNIPAVLRWGAKHAGFGGRLTAKILAASIRKNIETLAREFMTGKDAHETMDKIYELRQQGFAATIDILGEAAVSEKEAQGYQGNYLALLQQLHSAAPSWPDLNDKDDQQLDWGHAPRINLSIKPTSLFSQADPKDFENSVDAIYKRFVPIMAQAREAGAFINIDMEQRRYKDITIAVYKKLRSAPDFRDYPHLGLVLQAYLKETETDLEALLNWARDEKLMITIRLVKGAYWDYETIIARQHQWNSPVFEQKWQTDAAFERLSRTMLENHDICSFACGSHNIRSIAAVMAMAEALQVPASRCEFQVLYGMAGPIRRALQSIAGQVRLYCPYGELLPGMGYLVRRLLENTANESFLRQSFAEGIEADHLLENPAQKVPVQVGASGEPSSAAQAPFHNEATADFTLGDLRQKYRAEIDAWRSSFGKVYPIIVDGKEILTSQRQESVNPGSPDEIIGTVCQAGRAEIDHAIEAARKNQESWRLTPAEKRADMLFAAAQLMREDLVGLAALQVLEVGKQWDQAHADITEAIDFLEYYGREMIRLGKGYDLGHLPGEENHYQYEPKGIAAVIAPWNFPLAISCGMCAAALVTGNCVLYKPSNLSPVTGSRLASIFREAGIPKGVFHFVPGRGETIGDYLVEHPEVHIIAFTGSMEVGLRIIGKSTEIGERQNHVKKVIAEMGGKNAIIVDDDADLDEAVPQVLASAFGYQGQKCSACSRVIVLEEIYQRFVDRLVEAADSISIGPAEDPRHSLGPVVSHAAQQKILRAIEIAGLEGNILLKKDIPDQGYYVPLTIVDGIKPEHRITQEEIFGPVLAVMKATNYDEAIKLANSTRFALTGGVFSRSPEHLEYARRHFRVGNLYFNRGITGALVGRQPFGGFRLSGVGSKAGGPDYLLQFMDPVAITENVMRRGFAPLEME